MMDKKFLNRVLDQLVRETRLGDDEVEIISPFLFSIAYLRPNIHSYISIRVPWSVKYHCRDVYGLNDDEIDYVWKIYKRIIIDKVYG